METRGVMTSNSSDPGLAQWFAGSKVIDDDGGPLRVFHGTTQEFTEFKRGRWPGTINDIGFWFATEKQTAEMFAGPKGVVLEVHLRIERPLYIDSYAELVDLWQSFAGGDSRLRNGDTDALRTWLISSGYDGLSISGGDMDSFANGLYLVALEPQQIKSSAQLRAL